MERILRLPEVKSLTGYSRSSIYLKVSKGAFPSPIHLGERSIGWLQSDIDAWIQQCIKKSEQRRGNKHENK